MFLAFLKAFRQLGDPGIRGALAASVAAAAAVFAGLWAAVGYLLAATALFERVWLDWIADALGGLAALVLAWLLFPGVVGAVLALMLDRVAVAVEAAHYPDLPKAPGAPLGASLAASAGLLAASVAGNLAVLAFLLVPPVFPFVFYAVNGYLLSREYFELVASRRLGRAEARALRKAHRGRLAIAGVVVALLLTVPVVNLLAPVVATAAMVHLVEAWRTEGGRA